MADDSNPSIQFCPPCGNKNIVNTLDQYDVQFGLPETDGFFYEEKHDKMRCLQCNFEFFVVETPKEK